MSAIKNISSVVDIYVLAARKRRMLRLRRRIEKDYRYDARYAQGADRESLKTLARMAREKVSRLQSRRLAAFLRPGEVCNAPVLAVWEVK
jgi:crotonobetainyl-CoA:carnitine CoA-transferase CaiB-like acyl-CoA transferase